MSALAPLHLSNQSFNISDFIDLSLCEVSTEDCGGLPASSYQKRELQLETEISASKIDGAIIRTWLPDSPHSLDGSKLALKCSN